MGSAQPRRALESDPGPAALSRDLSRAASRRRVSRAPGRCVDRVRVRCIDRDRGDRFFLRRPRRQPRPARREMNCVVTEEQAGRSEWRLLADPNGAPADCRPEGSVPTHAPSRSATGAADGNHGRRSEPHQPSRASSERPAAAGWPCRPQGRAVAGRRSETGRVGLRVARRGAGTRPDLCATVTGPPQLLPVALPRPESCVWQFRRRFAVDNLGGPPRFAGAGANSASLCDSNPRWSMALGCLESKTTSCVIRFRENAVEGQAASAVSLILPMEQDGCKYLD